MAPQSLLIWTFILKNTNGTYDKFKARKTLIENENENEIKIKILRIDNGLELYNSDFDRLCNDSEIRRHRIV